MISDTARKEMKLPSRFGEAVVAARNILVDAGVADPSVTTEWLFTHVVGCSRAEFVLRQEDLLVFHDIQWIAHALERLVRHEPLQYVLGEMEFMDLSLKVDARALIPRPETEELVSLVMEDHEIRRMESPVVADIGTGCGCIVLAMAAARPDGRYIATDLSAEALELARENAVIHGLESVIDWRNTDLLEGLQDLSLDAVVSNPPYISTASYWQLEPHIREYEPRMALDAGESGLETACRLIGGAYRALKMSGRIYIEIGADQGESMKDALEDKGFSQVEIIRDLGGLDRFIRAVK